MNGRMNRWGIGPQIAVAALTYAAVAGAATRRWPEVCLMRTLPFITSALVGGILILLGAPMLVVAARTVMTGYNKDQLVTSGLSAIVRHPIYSAWIVFIFPGLVMLTRSWPLLLTSLVAYVVFKLRAHCEDEYLKQRFGEAYLTYRERVNELIPIPRRL
ncbi:MAG: isoprenylcysteine carboxylmethyltransferase family protein [Candidatus Sulfotelmatobacter sp.]